MSALHLRLAFALFLAALPGASAQTTWQGIASADAFVAAGSASNPAGSDLTAYNYGGAGALAVAGAATAKGGFQSLLRFDLAAAVSQFNATFGAGQWEIASVTLTLAANFGTAGGQPSNLIFNPVAGGGFAIDWLINDAWMEGTGTPPSPSTNGITLAALPSLLSDGRLELGRFTYDPPGNDVPVTWTLTPAAPLVADLKAGGPTSLLLRPTAPDVAYLINARTFPTNRPTLTLVAVPEPAPLALLAAAVVFAAWVRRRHQ